MALVLKKWHTNENPQSNESKIHIHGREEGLISFAFSIIGIDPTTTFQLSDNKLVFSNGSWEGQKKIIVPISSISSCYFGYTKPWKQALVIGIITMPIFFIGAILGPLYYFLNKQLELGIRDTSGATYALAFKRSVIENVKIDETEGNHVLSIIEKTMDQHFNAK